MHNKRIFISYVAKINEKEELLKIIELVNQHGNYKAIDIFESTHLYIGDIDDKSTSSGGKMIQFSNNEILLGIGDFAQWEYAADTYPNIDLDFGKMLVINIDSKKTKQYSKGHRNPQGLVKVENYILETEHGPDGGDEINLIDSNEDYGWPFVSYGAEYEELNPDAKINNKYGVHEGYKKPIYSFLPSIGIKAIEFLPESEKEFPKWKNNFFVCSTRGIYRVSLDFNKKANLIFASRLDDRRPFQQTLKIVPGCRDLQISSKGKIITNNGNLITKNAKN